MADATTMFPDIGDLGYEAARDELVGIVAKLEAGQAPLEDSMQLWRRGEALAAHCARWLDGAQAEIEGNTTEGKTTQGKTTEGNTREAATLPPTADQPLHADGEIFDEPGN